MRRRSFIVRVWLKPGEAVAGMVSDPILQMQWSFQGEQELFLLVDQLLEELGEEDKSGGEREIDD